MTRTGEQARVLETVVLPKSGMDEWEWKSYDLGIRDEAQKAQNVDKWFAHYVTHYKPDQPVGASFEVEE
jgi:hypothetical protein